MTQFSLPGILGCSVILLLATSVGTVRAQTATTILVDGPIWTENPAVPEAEAVALDGPRILAVGSTATVWKLAGPGCNIIDLHRRRVVPGFNDSHVHFRRR